VEWQGIQIPKVIMILLDRKELHLTFFNDKRENEDHPFLFYERNPAGSDLDFDDHPEDKLDFVKYAMELRFLNPAVDTKKTPLAPMEDLAAAVTILLQVGLHHNKEPRKELEQLLQAKGITKEWFPESHGPCNMDLRINTHLGARGVMTLDRIQDPEGTK